MNIPNTITINKTDYDARSAVGYHYGQFPPESLDLSLIIGPMTDAAMALVRYDSELRQLPRSGLLLAPLRARDAVVSSRMEGTISTIEEVLRLEADADSDHLPGFVRNESLEVALYARALRQAEQSLRDGYSISEALIRNAHKTLLFTGRGSDSKPGNYKIDQNYIGDKRARKIDYVPIAPPDLPRAMQALIELIRADHAQDTYLPLIRAAIAHAEFEALHPFDDGNGRIGRMLIPLHLWQSELLSAPHFFVSDYFETHKTEYIDRLRAVSQNGEWSEWAAFFCTALHSQAEANLSKIREIKAHYEEMREIFRDLLRSRWSPDALDYIFANPIFRNNRFKRNAGIPPQTANTFTKKLVDAELLSVVVPPSGRAPGMYAFRSLLGIVSG